MMTLDNNETISGKESAYTRKNERDTTNDKREKQLIIFDVIVERVTAPIVSLWTNYISGPLLYSKTSNHTNHTYPSLHTEDQSTRNEEERRKGR
jgi:hypothetical protein